MRVVRVMCVCASAPRSCVLCVYARVRRAHLPKLTRCERVGAHSAGELQVKAAPRAVDERDDKLLANLMMTMEQQNQEVAGDSGDEEEEEQGMGSVDIA